jgi:O-acetylserine/cysteine efflux transporter
MALTLVVMVIWGFNFAVAKTGLEQFSPLFMMFLRFAAVAAVLVPFVRIPHGRMRGIFALSVILGGIHFPLMFGGLAGIDAATAAITVQLQVPFSALLAALVFKDRIDARGIIGMIIAFLGVVVIAGEPRLNGNYVALGMVVAAAFAFAVANIQMKRVSAVNGFSLNAWMSLMAAPQLLIFTLLLERDQVRQFTQADWLGWSSIAYMSVVVTILSYGIWYHLVRRYAVSQTMPWTLTVPVFGVLSGVLVLGEPMTTGLIVGGTLTLIGVAVIVLRRRRFS